MAIRRGEIYLVNLDDAAIGSEQCGTRPVLIIQNDIGNTYSATVIGAACTKTLKKKCDYHVEISAADSGLDGDGIVKLEQIRTLSKNRLIKKIGKLSEDKMQEVDEAIKVSLGLI